MNFDVKINDYSDLVIYYKRLETIQDISIEWYQGRIVHKTIDKSDYLREYYKKAFKFLEEFGEYIIIESDEGVMCIDSDSNEEIFKEFPKELDWQMRLIETCLGDFLNNLIEVYENV